MLVTSPLRLITRLLVAGLFCSVTATAAQPILRCPDIKGLCRWQEDRWELYWKAETTEELVDFAVIGSRVVVLLRGHLSPGRVVVLDERGESLLVRHLGTGRPLGAVIGEAPGGFLLLCNDLWGSALCDTWLPEAPTPATLRTPWVPHNCLFPRFLGGRLFCVDVEDSPERVLWIGSGRPISGRFERIPLGFAEGKWLEQLHPMEGNRFIIRTAYDLFLADQKGEALEVSGDGQVFWSQQVAPDQVIFSECWIQDLALSRCEITSVAPDARTRQVWSSDHLWPSEFARMRENRYLIHLTNDEEQALAMVEPAGDAWTSTIVWRGDAPSETTDQPRPKGPPLVLIGEWVNFVGYEIAFHEDGLVVYFSGAEAETSRLRPDELGKLTRFLASDEFAAALDLLRDSSYRSGGDDMHEVGFSYRGESFGYSVAQAGCDKELIAKPVAKVLDILNELAGRHFSDVRQNPIPKTVCD